MRGRNLDLGGAVFSTHKWLLAHQVQPSLKMGPPCKLCELASSRTYWGGGELTTVPTFSSVMWPHSHMLTMSDPDWWVLRECVVGTWLFAQYLTVNSSRCEILSSKGHCLCGSKEASQLWWLTPAVSALTLHSRLAWSNSKTPSQLSTSPPRPKRLHTKSDTVWLLVWFQGSLLSYYWIVRGTCSLVSFRNVCVCISWPLHF